MHGRGNNQHGRGHKKDGHTAVEIHYNYSRHEQTPHSRGASEGCRAKLPRWSFSRSSCTYASGTALDRSMVGSHPQRVKLFCAASRIFGAPRAEILVVAVPLPASFLALSPSGPPLTALSVSGSAPRLEDTAAIHTQKPTG